jgi:hypothetical protein
MSLLHNRANNTILSSGYTITKRVHGHVKTMGVDSGKEKNPLWIVRDKNDCELILMFCEPESIVQMCKQSYSKIVEYETNHNNGNKITWHNHTTGYILGSCCMLFIHQVIMDCYGNGKGTGNISVDHIDRNPLNNRMDNLRIATREEQQMNTKGIMEGTKRDRQYQARSLPEGIRQRDMPKYVTYNVNVWDKDTNKTRDFFRIEGHPLISPKIWESSKSTNVSIHDKLNSTIEMLKKFDDGIVPEVQKLLPTHVQITKNADGRHSLIYDNRKDKQTKRMLIDDVDFDPNDEDQKHKQLYIFNYHIEKTYGKSIFTDDFQYKGESFEITNRISLPKNICVVNEHGKTILLYQKKIREIKLSARINLTRYYDLPCETQAFTEDIESKLLELNINIIHKYGIEHAICEVPEVIPEKAAKEFPMYTRIKTVENGDSYLVFDKKNDNNRISTTIKLPNNYNMNFELHRLNEKVVELYGVTHELDLTRFPLINSEIQIAIPENIFVNLTCKCPYVINSINKMTASMVLPSRYDLTTELGKIGDLAIPDIEHEVEYYKNTYDVWKPDNVSIMNKDGKNALLYQKRTKEYKHCISLTLPIGLFNINLQLIKINSKILEKYGKEFCILKTA